MSQIAVDIKSKSNIQVKVVCEKNSGKCRLISGDFQCNYSVDLFFLFLFVEIILEKMVQ